MISYDSLNTFMWLCWRDMRVLGKDFWNNVLDSLLLPTSFVVVSGYLMPALGLPADYGTFMLVSSVLGMCLNTPSTYSGELVADLEGPKNISYELTLPLSCSMVYHKIATVYALKAAILNIFVFPWGFLLLKGNVDLSHVSWFKFVLIYILSNIFYAFYTLCVAVWVKDTVSFGRFWIRWGWQIFVLAGWQFSWYMLYKVLPYLAYADLFNPILYTIEGTRAALLGQHGFINFWLCVLALLIATFLFGYLGLKRFRKRLDCV